MIEVQGLGFRYAGRKAPALCDVTFRLERGESLLVLGPSGCGKSTLALCLNGAIPHFVEGDLSGTVCVDGADTGVSSMAELAQRVGLVFQDPEAQFCMLKVDEEVAFGLENLAVPRDHMRTRIVEALHSVGLQHREHDRIEQLSGGQKQRLALACVLAQRPEVLVFDEPTAQLDPAAAAEVIGLLGELRARGDHTLIIIEHRLDDLMHLIDKVLVLDATGQVVAFGPPRDVMRSWCRWLMQAGVWVPQVSELATRLGERGIHLDPFPMTVSEAAAVLRPFLAGEALRSRNVERADTPEMQPSVLRTDSLSYGYSPERRALDHVSIDVRAGQITAIAGANGAGKSTLARLIVRILQPPSGSIWQNDRDIRDYRSTDLARQIGYVFQYPEHQFIGRTLLDDVAFSLRRAGVTNDRAQRQALEMLTHFGLDRLAAASPFTLSHGEQRRLSVASLLVLGQNVLLLDEPTFGQDRSNYDELLNELATRAAGGRAIVTITHDMRLVAERAHRVIVLSDGEVVFDGSPRLLFADDLLLRLAHLTTPPLLELSHVLGLERPLVRVTELVDLVDGARQAVSAR